MPERTRRTGAAQAPTTSTPEIQLPDLGSNAAAQEAMQTQEGGVRGFLTEQIRDNLGADKVDDAITGGVDSGGDWLKDLMVEHASDEDKAIAREHGGAAVDGLTTDINGKIVDSQIGEGVSGFLADNPYLTTGLAVAGAAGYILSDQDIELGTDFKIGDHHKLDIEGEFGSTLDPGFDALRGGYTFDNGTHRARVEGGSRFDRDEWDVRAEYMRRFENGSTLKFDGSHTDKGGDTFSTLGARYDSKDFDAFAKGSYDSAEDLGRFQAGFDKTGKGPDWRGRLDADTTGRWDANLGVSHTSDDGNLEWFAGVGGGQTAAGDSNFSAKAGLTWKF